MSRLADYFVVVGYDFEKDKNGFSSGKILQKFPNKDWEDTPFNEGIELFCQPQGWALVTAHQAERDKDTFVPTFFISVLTDIDAERHYCACLTFREVVKTNLAPNPKEQLNLISDPSQDLHFKEMEESIIGSPPSIYFSACEEACTPKSTTTFGPPPRLDQPNQNGQFVISSYAPKCLVLVSRLTYFETFRTCLGYIYTTYLQNGIEIMLEKLIGTLLTTTIPFPGNPQFTFSLGVGDQQIIQPPLSPLIPSSGTVVATLFKQLGIHNSLLLVNGCLTDCKILIHSQSYQRLTDACNALIILLFPLKYNNVFIPILPASLMEILNAPTPFIMGIHSSLISDINEFYDIIIADMDAGSLNIPESVVVPLMPKFLYQSTLDSLSLIMNPDLEYADQAFPKEYSSPSPPSLLDKEIRAIFMRMFAHLLMGYRSCLLVSRVAPAPYITFHKYKFIGARDFVGNDFIAKIFDSMSFNSFINERGLPYRPIDLFDEIYGTIGALLKNENGGDKEILKRHIRYLALQMSYNECPTALTTERLPKPLTNVDNINVQEPFPLLDSDLIEGIIANFGKKENSSSVQGAKSLLKKKIVPFGEDICQEMLDGNTIGVQHRFKTFKNCIENIFNNKLVDAQKAFPSALRLLGHKVARIILCHQLTGHAKNNNRAILDGPQFNMIVQLMNTALQNETVNDENGIAAALLPLSSIFCHKLCTGIIQFAYSSIQCHVVWSNLSFWETTFYTDVEKQLKVLYQNNAMPSSNNICLGSNESCAKVHAKRGLDVVCGELKKLELLNGGGSLRTFEEPVSNYVAECSSMEEATIYSLATHYVNQLVYLRLPLDCNITSSNTTKYGTSIAPNSKEIIGTGNAENYSNVNNTSTLSFNERCNKKLGSGRKLDSITTSSPSIVTTSGKSLGEGSESIDNESGFEEDMVDVSSNLARFIIRFVDKIGTELSVTKEHIESLNQMIPGVISMHMETLETVNREIQRLPSVIKPKIMTPHLLPGEEFMIEGLRAYILMPVPSSEISANLIGPSLLPSQGCFYVTNYRLIYKGVPFDSMASEFCVIKSMPIASLLKIKRSEVGTSTQYLAKAVPMGSCSTMHFRSSVCQVLSLSFDTDVSAADLEYLYKLIKSLRYPESIYQLAYINATSLNCTSAAAKTLSAKSKRTKAQTLKSFAKKTLFTSNKSSNARLAKPFPTLHPNSSSTLPQGIREHNISPHPGLFVSGPTKGPAYPRRFKGQTNGSPQFKDERMAEHGRNGIEECDSIYNGGQDPYDDDTLSVTSNSVASKINGEKAGHTFSNATADVPSLQKLYGPNWYLSDFQRLGLLSRSKELEEILQETSSSPLEINLSPIRMAVGPAKNGICKEPYSNFKISSANSAYSLCKSYPAYILCPRTVTDEDLRKIAKSYKHNRLPVVVWKHSERQALLLRSSGFNARTLLRMIKSKHTSPNLNDGNVGNYLAEQQKYISAIINATSLSCRESPTSSAYRTSHNNNSNRGSFLSLNSSMTESCYQGKKRGSAIQRAIANIKGHSGKLTGNNITSSTTNSMVASSPYVSNLRQNLKLRHGPTPENATKNSLFSPNSSLYGHRNNQRISLQHDTDGYLPLSSTTNLEDHPDAWSERQESMQQKIPHFSALYFVGDKSQIKNIKIDNLHNFTFIPFEYVDNQGVKLSFKKLLNACQTSSQNNSATFSSSTRDVETLTNPHYKNYGKSINSNVQRISNLTNLVLNPTLINKSNGLQGETIFGLNRFKCTFLTQLQSSGWYQQLFNVMRMSVLITDIIDVTGASVIIGLEDGGDITAQVVSLVEILLDPYYRTFEGFRALVEKEWFSFGHKFTQRLSLIAAYQDQGFTPIFLQFLDLVHQVQKQFPLSFEFNEYYLKYVAYHHCSLRFKTFVGDSESDRLEIHANFGAATAKNGRDLSYAIPEFDMWKEIGSLKQTDPALFRNWSFIPTYGTDSNQVLRPVVQSLADLHLWSYYAEQFLGHSSPYDLEILYKELPPPLDSMVREGKASSKRRFVMNRLYQSPDVYMPSRIAGLVKEIERLESKLKLEPTSYTPLLSSIINKIDSDHSLAALKGITDGFADSGRRFVKEHTKTLMLEILRGNPLPKLENSTGKLHCSNSATYLTQNIPENQDLGGGHFYVKHRYTSPLQCDVCSGLLWDVLHKSGYQCKYCDHNCHDKCRYHSEQGKVAERACPKTYSRQEVGRQPLNYDPEQSVCTEEPSIFQNTLTSCSNNAPSQASLSHDLMVVESPFAAGDELASKTTSNGFSNGENGLNLDNSTNGLSHSDASSINTSGLGTMKTRAAPGYDNYFSSKSSSCATEGKTTHEGYLYKRGALFKGWKQRWFVLDCMRHQLRYYDTVDDANCKGVIDLKEVISVSASSINLTNGAAPKNIGENSCFDVKTVKRIYNFIAYDDYMAREWIEKIQSCLQ